MMHVCSLYILLRIYRYRPIEFILLGLQKFNNIATTLNRWSEISLSRTYYFVNVNFLSQEMKGMLDLFFVFLFDYLTSTYHYNF